MPQGILGCFTNPLTRKQIPIVLRELFLRNRPNHEETILEFFSRRFNENFAKQFADPLTTGIYAGDISQLSLDSCFPQLKRVEEKHGSLLLGLIKEKKKNSDNPWIKQIQSHSLFSFKEGLEQLPKALEKKLKNYLLLNCEVKSLVPRENKIDVAFSDGFVLSADHVFSTLSFPYLRQICPAALFSCVSLKNSSVIVVNAGYKKSVLKHHGFGYLIPNKEKQSILGMIWNSSIFPQQNAYDQETRLTIMLGGENNPEIVAKEKADIADICHTALREHLQITDRPDILDIHYKHHAIPQYHVGHHSSLQHIQKAVARFTPHITLLGTSFHGVSLNDCITNAKHIANSVL